MDIKPKFDLTLSGVCLLGVTGVALNEAVVANGRIDGRKVLTLDELGRKHAERITK